jgi:hypothetical protein
VQIRHFCPLALPSLSESCLAGRIMRGVGAAARQTTCQVAGLTHAEGLGLPAGLSGLVRYICASQLPPSRLGDRSGTSEGAPVSSGTGLAVGVNVTVAREAATERCGHGAVGRPCRGCTSNTIIPACHTKTAAQTRLNRQCQRPWSSSSSAHSGCLEQGAVEAARE